MAEPKKAPHNSATVTVYKHGVPPQNVHRIDLSAWTADGYVVGRSMDALAVKVLHQAHAAGKPMPKYADIPEAAEAKTPDAPDKTAETAGKLAEALGNPLPADNASTAPEAPKDEVTKAREDLATLTAAEPGIAGTSAAPAVAAAASRAPRAPAAGKKTGATKKGAEPAPAA